MNAWQATDWLARTCAATWMRAAGAETTAASLEQLAPITPQTVEQAEPVVTAARELGYVLLDPVRAPDWSSRWNAAGAALHLLNPPNDELGNLSRIATGPATQRVAGVAGSDPAAGEVAAAALYAASDSARAAHRDNPSASEVRDALEASARRLLDQP